MPDWNELGRFYDEVKRLTTEKGWRDNIPPMPRFTSVTPLSEYVFPAYVALLHSEASEMLEACRDKTWSALCETTVEKQAAEPNLKHLKACSGKPHSTPKPVGVGPEMADVFIRLIDMADIWGIDLDYEVFRVLRYGWTREYKHGGRGL